MTSTAPTPAAPAAVRQTEYTDIIYSSVDDRDCCDVINRLILVEMAWNDQVHKCYQNIAKFVYEADQLSVVTQAMLECVTDAIHMYLLSLVLSNYITRCPNETILLGKLAPSKLTIGNFHNMTEL